MSTLRSFALLALSFFGSSIALTAPAAASDYIGRVPEPMTALIVGAGLVGVAFIRRRKS